jgi:hypothetical protein
MNIKKVLEYNTELYSIGYSNTLSFEFRLLKIKEFNLFNKLLTGGIHEYLIYEEIFEICYIGNYKYLPNSLSIGYIITTGNLIYNLSGADSSDNFLFKIAEERKEQNPNSLLEHMKAVICIAFSSISPLEIDQMTENQLIKIFVSAENVLSKQNESFVRIDLKKIYDELNAIVDKPKKEYVSDNEMLEKEIGYWNLKEAEDKFINDEKQKISKEVLQSLDRR